MTQESSSNIKGADYDVIDKKRKALMSKFRDQHNLDWEANLNWTRVWNKAVSPGHESPSGKPGETMLWKLTQLPACLEIGCGNQSEEGLMSTVALKFHTIDPDPTVDTTYNDFDDIPGNIKYTCVIAKEVFEHIPKDKIIDFTKDTYDVMQYNGFLVASIPNIYNPVGFLQNPDHVTNMDYAWFGSILESCGFDVVDVFLCQMSNIELSQKFNRLSGDENFNFIVNVMKQFYSLHPAKSLVVVAKKNLPS